MKQNLTHLLAAAQLAEMHYQADQSAHKKRIWEKAQTEYEQAAEAVRVLEKEPLETDNMFLEILEGLEQDANKLVANIDQLEAENKTLAEENYFLKNQLIEKDQKINELEKSALSGKPATPETTPAPAAPATPETTPAAPATPETTPAPAPARPLTGAAKINAEKKAAKLLAEAETKKNS